MVVFIHVCFVVVDLCVYTKKNLDSPFCSIKLSANFLRIFATIFSGFMGAPRCHQQKKSLCQDVRVTLGGWVESWISFLGFLDLGKL